MIKKIKNKAVFERLFVMLAIFLLTPFLIASSGFWSEVSFIVKVVVLSTLIIIVLLAGGSSLISFVVMIFKRNKHENNTNKMKNDNKPDSEE
jgi:hypothetical protein